MAVHKASAFVSGPLSLGVGGLLSLNYGALLCAHAERYCTHWQRTPHRGGTPEYRDTLDGLPRRGYQGTNDKGTPKGP